MVVGTSCSGKTTLARRVADALGAPHVELDALHWGPDWTERPVDEFRDAVRERVEGDRWVVDGNYAMVRDLVLPRATDAIWLNYAFPIVFSRALSRTSWRAMTGHRIYSGNRETFRRAFLSGDSILAWVIRTHGRYAVSYREFFESGPGAGVRLTELRRPRDADDLLERLCGRGRVNAAPDSSV